jgi:phosphatidylglycerol:prolipoprotein diacylglycerol transferase
MISYRDISPDLFQIGPFHIRWYGLMYVLAFVAAYLLIPRQRRSKEIGLRGAVVDGLMFRLIIGLIIGAKLGYLLFYR